MRQSLDIKRFFSKRDANTTTQSPIEQPPARPRAKTTGDVEKRSRTDTDGGFWKANISSLGRRVTRRGKRKTRVCVLPIMSARN